MAALAGGVLATRVEALVRALQLAALAFQALARAAALIAAAALEAAPAND